MSLTASGIGYVAALVLALVFLVAGAGKLAYRTETIRNFAALGIPRPRLSATVVPLVELTLAVLLVAFPVAGGLASIVVLAAFNLWLYRLVRRGTDAPCGCLGAPRSTDRPVSLHELARNVALALLAVGAVLAVPSLPSAAELAVTAVLVAAGFVAVGRIGRSATGTAVAR